MSRESNNAIQLWFANYPDQLLDVRSFSVIERINGLWSVEVRATIQSHVAVAFQGQAFEPGNIPFDSIVDFGAALSLDRTNRELPVRVWSGICSELTLVSEGQGQATDDCVYALTLVPELFRLTLRRNTRVFQHESIPEIVIRLLKDWKLEVDDTVILRNLDPSDQVRFPRFEYRVQYEETDYAFFCRLLEEAGISFYFDYDHDKAAKAVYGEADTVGRDLTKLVLDADPQIAQEPSSEDEADGGADESGEGEQAEGDANAKMLIGPLPYLGTQPRSLHGNPVDAVVNASAARSLRPGAVTLLDHDFRHPAWERLGRPKQEAKYQVDTTESKYEVLAYSPGLLQREQNDAAGDEYVEIAKAKNARAVDALLGVRGDALVTQFQTNALQIGAGSVVAFGDAGPEGWSPQEHSREELATDQNHLVIETQIHGDMSGGWFVSCWAVPADPEVPYRPPQITPRPRILGVQSALVVGDKSAELEQIFCDRYGRVRIQFHWDRQHQYGDPAAKEVTDPLGSCWVRVGTPWAGSSYGFVAIPRVGHEVLVSFLDGNPDRPVIVGSLYNGAMGNPAPYPLSGKQETRTGLKSNTTTGGNGFNEMYFEDQKGAERIHFQAQKNLSTIVKAAESRSVGASRTTKIGTTDTLHVGTQFELAVGQQGTGITVHENTYIILQVGGDSGAQIMLSGTGIYAQAKSDIHLHAGANIHLSAKGQINIDGGKVNINCGQPEEVQLPGYAKAQAPDRGRAIPGGPKPVGGGGMPEGPGALKADVPFPKVEADDEDVPDSADGEPDVPDESPLRGERPSPDLKLPGTPLDAPLAARPGLSDAAATAGMGLVQGADPKSLLPNVAAGLVAPSVPGLGSVGGQALAAVATGGGAAALKGIGTQALGNVAGDALKGEAGAIGGMIAPIAVAGITGGPAGILGGAVSTVAGATIAQPLAEALGGSGNLVGGVAGGAVSAMTGLAAGKVVGAAMGSGAPTGAPSATPRGLMPGAAAPGAPLPAEPPVVSADTPSAGAGPDASPAKPKVAPPPLVAPQGASAPLAASSPASPEELLRKAAKDKAEKALASKLDPSLLKPGKT
jgi:type VI secretion system secreted protein VgrG